MKKTLLLLTILFSVKLSTGQISVVDFSLGYTAPVDIKNCGDNRLFIVEQNGYISICDTDGTRRPVPFLDIHGRVRYGGEQGLLGLAFAPDFLTSGYFYVNYISNTDDDTHISRFRVSQANPDSADPNSEELILHVYQPFSNHNGGHIYFGPDGYLYIGMGDGGSGGDPGNRAQNPDSLLGKMLRLEVDPSYPGYHIPPTNVFASDTTLGRPEIWALGVRNPWRWSFDRATGDLWIADVGQDQVEEIDFQPRNAQSGLNYGWKCWEAYRQYSTAAGCQPYSSYTPPVHYYTHQPGGYCSITGGYRYRGSKFQELYGKYFYADYCNSQIQYLYDSSGAYGNINLGNLGASSVTTFGEDKNGEMYLSSSNNKIMKLISLDCSPVSTINLGRDTVSDCGSGSVSLNVPFGNGSTYEWRMDTTLVGNFPFYNATQPGTYHLTVNNNGCSGSDSVVVVFSTPAPVTFTGLDTLYCIYNNPVILTPSIPGGNFTGEGISSNAFYPSNAGIGTHDVVYSLTDNAGCTSTDTQSVRVDACLTISDPVAFDAFSIIPNPSAGSYSLRTYSLSEKAVDIALADLTGRIISEEIYIVNRGYNSIDFSQTLAHGIYLMKISDDKSSAVFKVVIE